MQFELALSESPVARALRAGLSTLFGFAQDFGREHRLEAVRAHLQSGNLGEVGRVHGGRVMALTHCDGPTGPHGHHFDDGSRAVKSGVSTVVIDPEQPIEVSR